MNDVALKEHLETQIAALREEVHKSEKLLNTRLEGMNEFRAALKDQAAQMATREYTDLQDEKLESRLRSLEDSRAYTVGVAAALALLVSAGGVIVSLFV